MGALSALPLVAAGNVCCCLWVVCGGMVAAYLLQQNQSTPITPADGALVGLLAGLIGAFVRSALSIPIDFLMAPFEQAMLQRILDTATLPPEVRELLQRYSGRDGDLSGAAFQIVGRIAGLMLWLFLGGIFSTIGGLVGSLIFRKDAPPPGVIDLPPQP